MEPNSLLTLKLSVWRFFFWFYGFKWNHFEVKVKTFSFSLTSGMCLGQWLTGWHSFYLEFNKQAKKRLFQVPSSECRWESSWLLISVSHTCLASIFLFSIFIVEHFYFSKVALCIYWPLTLALDYWGKWSSHTVERPHHADVCRHPVSNRFFHIRHSDCADGDRWEAFPL